MQLFLFQSRVLFLFFGFFVFVFCLVFLFVYMRPFSLICVARKVYVTLVGSTLKAFSCGFRKYSVAALKVHVVK